MPTVDIKTVLGYFFIKSFRLASRFYFMICCGRQAMCVYKKKGGSYGKEKTHLWFCCKNGRAYFDAFKGMEARAGEPDLRIL